jgi:pimeloyl-ACP methyl ester carboxylesterase
MSRCVVLALVIGLAPFLLVGAPTRAGAQSGPPEAPLAGRFDVGGGRRLYLECRGTGRPTVVLEAGAHNSGAVWDAAALPPGVAGPAVPDGVAAFARVCVYDRPGTLLTPTETAGRSRSDPAPLPRTAQDVVADLRALLRAAGVPGPYVLVGHSLGGVFVRLYAATYPEEVAGLVLVDSSHEEQSARLRALLTPEQWATFEGLTSARLELPGYPELEWVDFEASFAQLRRAAARPLRPLPLVVLSRGVAPDAAQAPEGFSPDTMAAMERVWHDLQAALAALVPGARRVVATESGHYIQLQQPELVIVAVREVVEAARRAPPAAARGFPRTGAGPGDR